MTHIARGWMFCSVSQPILSKERLPPSRLCVYRLRRRFTPDSIDCAGGSVIISPLGSVLGGPNYEGEALISADLGTDHRIQCGQSSISMWLGIIQGLKYLA